MLCEYLCVCLCDVVCWIKIKSTNNNNIVYIATNQDAALQNANEQTAKGDQSAAREDWCTAEAEDVEQHSSDLVVGAVRVEQHRQQCSHGILNLHPIHIWPHCEVLNGDKPFFQVYHLGCKFCNFLRFCSIHTWGSTSGNWLSYQKEVSENQDRQLKSWGLLPANLISTHWTIIHSLTCSGKW